MDDRLSDVWLVKEEKMVLQKKETERNTLKQKAKSQRI